MFMLFFHAMNWWFILASLAAGCLVGHLVKVSKSPAKFLVTAITACFGIVALLVIVGLANAEQIAFAEAGDSWVLTPLREWSDGCAGLFGGLGIGCLVSLLIITRRSAKAAITQSLS